MPGLRHDHPRCSKCYEKHWLAYRRGEIYYRPWVTNIEWVRCTGSGHVLRCLRCGHEWYSQSQAAWRLYRLAQRERRGE